MEKVKIMDHPLIQHKIGWLRRSSTGSRDFRGIVGEIAMLMCYEATRGLELEDIEVETPICAATVKELKEAGDCANPQGRAWDGGRHAGNDPSGESRAYRPVPGP